MSGFASGIKGLFGKKPKPAPVITMAGPDPENAEKEVVLAGHGAYCPEVDGRYNGGKVRLPPGVTICFWCRHGEGLSNTIAKYIETHKDIRSMPKDLWLQIIQSGRSAASRSPNDGSPEPEWTPLPEIVHGGEEIWNYRLVYPEGLSLSNVPMPWLRKSRYTGKAGGHKGQYTHTEPKGVVGDRRYCIVPPLNSNLHVAERGVPIVALLAAHWNICNGAIVHWCACRSISAGHGPAPSRMRL